LAHAGDSTFRNYGFNLPSPPAQSGFDEVRASDGTTCRSSMGGNGAYLDVGGIGGQSDASSGSDNLTVYGRLIVPLGAKPGRIDCSSLYNLEIERLKAELRIARSSVAGGVAGRKTEGWDKTGWNNE